MNESMFCCECRNEIKPNGDAYTVVNGDCEDIICKECAKKHADAEALK